jgi:K+ transporter
MAVAILVLLFIIQRMGTRDRRHIRADMLVTFMVIGLLGSQELRGTDYSRRLSPLPAISFMWSAGP